MADATDKPKPRRRRRRWLRRSFGSLGVLLVLLLVAVLVLLRNLQSPSVKAYLKQLARAQAKIDLEYRGIDVGTSGLSIDALVVQSPEAFRAVAPDLLRVGSLFVGWSRTSLFGGGPKLTEVVIRDVEIVIVRDEDGRTSLDALSPPPDPNAPSSPPVPLSRLLEEPLKNAPAAASVTIERARLTLLQRNKNREVVERWKLEGAGLSVRAEREGKSWRLVTSAGAQKQPLELLLTRDGEKKGEALAKLWLDARATPAVAAAQIDVEIARQNLAPEVKLSRALHVEATVKFDPAKQRTEIAIARTQLADGAATVEAAVEIPDGKPPLVSHAEGDLDVDRLIASLPEGVLPVTARNARLRYKCDRLLLERVPYFLDGGALSADGAIGFLGAGPLQASDARLTIEAKPAKDLSSTALKAKIPLGSVRLAKQLSGSGLVVSLEGRLTRALAFTGDVALGYAQVNLAAPHKISARDGRVEISAHDFTLDPANPLAARGRVQVDGKLGGVDFANAGLRALVENATLSAQARLSGKAPYAIEAELPVERVRLADGRGKALLNGRAKVSLHASDVWPDLARAERTRAAAKVAVELDTLKATVDAKKLADALEYEIAADAPSLAPARLLLASLGDVPWEKVGLSLRAKGKIDRLASKPEIDHHSEVRFDHPSYKNSSGGFSAQSLTVVANGAGHARKFAGDVDVRTRALSVNNAKLGDGHVALKVAADSSVPKLSLKLDADGDGAPKGALQAAVNFDRAKKIAHYELEGSLANLKPLGPLFGAVRALKFFDLSRLGLAVSGKGSFHGAVDAIGPDFQVKLAKDLALTAGGDSTMEVRVSHFAWENDAWEVSTPQAIWRGTMSTEGDQRKLRSELTASELHLASVDNLLNFEGIKDTLDLTITGDLRKVEGAMVHTLAVRHLEQDFAESYPVGDVVLALKGEHNADGVVKVSELRLDNPAAGTRLELAGGVDLGERRRSLSVKGTVEQNLQRLSTSAQTFSGRGRVTLGIAVDSGNLRVFHARAGMKIADAWVKMPKAQVEIDAAEGEVPFSADLVLGPKGLRLLRKASNNAYSELRFADQHPLLANRSFISLQRIATPAATLGPVAGNLTVADNLISLSQLEAGFKSGRITGQCLFNYDGEDSTVQLKVRASHIIADNKDEFDGNIAILLDVGSRSVEGRAEILRIGRRHLLDLLDLHDPHHSDVAVNRIRRALALGYPDRVRLAFNHGFAGVKVTFGGLASLVRIDELRGIPMGPIIDKVMAKLKPTEEEGT